MADITNLDELVGGDVVFQYEGVEYAIPGDIPTDDVFRLFEGFRALSASQSDGAPETIKREIDQVKAHLLELFKRRHPELESLPFGMKTLPVVIQKVLEQLGVSVEADVPPTPPAPAAKRSSRTPPKSTARSRRSSGSRK